MIRLGALVWLVLVVAAGFVTFKVKYAVQDIEDELNRVRKHTIAEQQEIRVLTAEWTYLTQPERLAELNRRFLQLGPIGTKQLQRTVEDIPFRPLPVPPPSAPPDIVVAATTAPPAPPAETVAPAPAEPMPAPAAEGSAASAASVLAALTIGQATASELPPGPAATATATLKPATGKAAAPVQLAKAAASRQPRSLEDLFSQIAETR
jgi:hypothetical protein